MWAVARLSVVTVGKLEYDFDALTQRTRDQRTAPARHQGQLTVAQSHFEGC